MGDLIQHWVDSQSDFKPDAIAVQCDTTGPITYGRLWDVANKIAKILVDCGMQRGDRAVICTDRSADAIIGMLGALKADLVYVPLHDRTPAERVMAIIRDCMPRCIICNNSTLTRLLEVTVAGSDIDLFVNLGGCQKSIDLRPFGRVVGRSEIEAQEVKARNYQSIVTDTAQILYTSGTTGVPKGVQISHQNVTSYIDWALDYFSITSNDRVLNTAPFNFDMSIFDIYCAQASGAELCIARENELVFPTLLARRIESKEITIWKAIPSLLRTMLAAKVVAPDRMKNLRHVVFSGDLVIQRDLSEWMTNIRNCRYYVGYGPTEATGMSTCHSVAQPSANADGAVPLGRACAGKEVRVLNADLNIAKSGEVGEIYIGGSGVSKGYWGDAVLTKERFLSNVLGASENNRFYKTGDRGYYGDDGLLYFVGRDDDQVKIQGYRIELGDVRSALQSSDNVLDADVLVHDMKSGDRCLIGVVVLRSGADVEDVARRLGQKLPRYMVPKRLVAVGKISRSERGKVDRGELRLLVDKMG